MRQRGTKPLLQKLSALCSIKLDERRASKTLPPFCQDHLNVSISDTGSAGNRFNSLPFLPPSWTSTRTASETYSYYSRCETMLVRIEQDTRVDRNLGTTSVPVRARVLRACNPMMSSLYKLFKSQY